MSRNYQNPTVPASWADTRETDMAVATAIHAISDSKRSPEQIWEAPTPAEWDHVKMALEEYVKNDLFPEQPEYRWGEEKITL